jgi:erythritol transport system substrate-binding protein
MTSSGTNRKVQDMIRRKIFAVAAIASFSALAITGCSSSEPEAVESVPTEGGLIAVIVPELDNPFFAAEGEAAVAEAEALGYTTTYQSHDGDAQLESDLIDAAIEAGAVAIILDNAGADDSIGAVQRATDAGIGVFLIDREINATGIAKAQIVADNAQGATAVAEVWVAALPDGGKYIELTGKETDTNAGVRSAGYNSVISQHPNLVLAQKETANWSQEEAFTKMETLLQAHPDIVGVIAGNDTMALGAVAAIDAAGLTGKVVVAGFDGSPDAAAAIEAGTMLVTGLQPVILSAQLAVQQADQWLKTGSTGQPEKQSINCINITADNVDKYTNWGIED